MESFEVRATGADEDSVARSIWRNHCCNGVAIMFLVPALFMFAATQTGVAVAPPSEVSPGIAVYERGDFTTALAMPQASRL